ncbi:phage antirepressor Ant [soil metagenome]
MTALDIFTYSGQQVRTVLIDGEPWFITGDVCDFFGVTNRNRVLQEIDGDDKGGTQIDTPGGLQTVATISETGLYSLLFALQPQKARGLDQSAIDARIEQVRAFKRWVTHEVLPSIRKTGSYVAPETPEQLFARALTAANEMLAAKDETIKVLEPKASAWDELVAASGDYEVADAAKILARAGVVTGRQRLFEQLRDIGWIHRGSSGRWKAYQSAVDDGYLAEKPMTHHHPRTGELVLDPPQVRVTVRGLERLRVRLGTLFLVPNPAVERAS